MRRQHSRRDWTGVASLSCCVRGMGAGGGGQARLHVTPAHDGGERKPGLWCSPVLIRCCLPQRRCVTWRLPHALRLLPLCAKWVSAAGGKYFSPRCCTMKSHTNSQGVWVMGGVTSGVMCGGEGKGHAQSEKRPLRRLHHPVRQCGTAFHSHAAEPPGLLLHHPVRQCGTAFLRMEGRHVSAPTRIRM